MGNLRKKYDARWLHWIFDNGVALLALLISSIFAVATLYEQFYRPPVDELIVRVNAIHLVCPNDGTSTCDESLEFSILNTGETTQAVRVAANIVVRASGFKGSDFDGVFVISFDEEVIVDPGKIVNVGRTGSVRREEAEHIPQSVLDVDTGGSHAKSRVTILAVSGGNGNVARTFSEVELDGNSGEGYKNYRASTATYGGDPNLYLEKSDYGSGYYGRSRKQRLFD